MHQVCVVGHVTSETIIVGNRCKGPTMGGSGFFSSIAYKTLGMDTELITRASENDRKHRLTQLQTLGINVRCRTTANSLTFENIYPSADSSLRTQKILKFSDPILSEDLTHVVAKVFHLGPLVAGDIDLSLVKVLSKRGTIVLDPQGFLRRREIGQVIQETSTDIRNAIKYVDILKVDSTESVLLTSSQAKKTACLMLQQWGPDEVLITDGSNGSILGFREKTWHIPAYPTRYPIDPTGCGDTYLAAYVSARLRGLPPYESAHIGSIAASHKIEYSGPLRANFDVLWKQFKAREPRSNN